MKYFYPEDLLEFHYKEMSPERSSEVSQALEESWSLREKMEVIREAAERLNKSMEAPRQEAIDHILKYASLRSKLILQ